MYKNLHSVIKDNKRWFSNEAMSFWDSRIESKFDIKTQTFITSDENFSKERKYNIRLVKIIYRDNSKRKKSQIITLATFDTLEEAQEYIKNYKI